MRIVCPKAALATALGAAGRIASAKSTIPVLGLVRLSAEAGSVELAATDMELSLRLPLNDATVEEPGAVLLPRLAADIVRSMADGPVTIEHRANEGTARVSGGNSSFNLNCRPADEFPELPPTSDGGLALPAAAVLATADRVGRSASRDETRPVLTGVLVRIDTTGLTMVATDSYRLAVQTADLGDVAGEPQEAIVPARALAELARLSAVVESETIEVDLSHSQAQFAAGGARLASRLIEGQFPDHRQLIPDAFEHELTFDRAELVAVLGRIGVLAQRGTALRLSFSSGQMTVSASQENVGEGAESVPVAFSGEELEVGFNVEFLRAGVESVEGDEVRLGIISPLRPGLLLGSDEAYRYLLMPIRLNP